MPEADLDARLFGDRLSVDAIARVALVPGPLPEGALDDAERALRDLATIEDRRGDEGEPSSPGDAAWRRLEAKLDLTLLLLARALPALRGPRPLPIRLGAAGLRLDRGASAPDDVAATAVLQWQPADALPVLLHLPVRRVGAEGGLAWWAFEPLAAALDDALERHVFRLHRRSLALRRPA